MSAPPRKLLDRVRDAIRLKHYSYRTEESYVYWIWRFILFQDKHSSLGNKYPNFPFRYVVNTALHILIAGCHR
jgi:hypothetical protein